MRFFIVHGSFGSPEENWFPWLATELRRLGHEVIIPAFPTPENQCLESWLQAFKPYLEKVCPDSCFVAHSLGPAFVLSVLERLNVRVKACFFVAGFLGALGNPKFDSLNSSFAEKRFNWEKIHKNCEQFFVISSRNDPFVPLSKGRELADKLKTVAIPVSNAGHFNTASGYTKFSELLQYILLSLRQQKVFTQNPSGETLVGLAAFPPKKKKKYPAIVLVHGFDFPKCEAGMFDQIAFSLSSEGFLVYRFDLSGTGESSGDFSETTLSKLSLDLDSILSFVKSQPLVDSKRIGVIGQSFGTSVILALKPKVQAIAFLGSIVHPMQVISRLFKSGFNPSGLSTMPISTSVGKQFWENLSEHDLLANASLLSCPLLFVFGSSDEMVPPQESKALYAAALEPKELFSIQSADHGYTEHRKQLLEKLKKWFKESL